MSLSPAGKHNEIRIRYAWAAKRHRSRNLRLGELRRLFLWRGTPEIEVANKIADLGDLSTWSPDALGQLVGLTWAEREPLGIRTIRCIDQTKEQIAAFYAAKKRKRDREAKQRERDARPGVTGLSSRARELLTVTSRTWATVRDLTEAVVNLPAFMVRRRRTDFEVRHRAVHRALDELREASLVDVDYSENERRQRITKIRRHE